MKRRDFVQASLLAGAASLPGIHLAYAAVRPGRAPDVAAVTGEGREITLRGAEIASWPRRCAVNCCSPETRGTTMRVGS